LIGACWGAGRRTAGPFGGSVVAQPTRIPHTPRATTPALHARRRAVVRFVVI